MKLKALLLIGTLSAVLALGACYEDITSESIPQSGSEPSIESVENNSSNSEGMTSEVTNEVTVRFMVDGVEYANSTGKEGEPISLPETAPTQEHKTFVGWDGYTDGDVYTEAKDYTAIFADTIYTVKFLDGENEVKIISGKYGETFEAPANPEKSGYDFLGWEGFDGTDLTIGGDATYTAKWEMLKTGIEKASDGTFDSTTLVKDTIFSTSNDIKNFALVQNNENAVGSTAYTVSLVHDNLYLYVYIYSEDSDRNDSDRLSFYIIQKGASKTTLVETYPNRNEPYSKGKDACAEINVGKVDGGYALKAKVSISSLEFKDGKIGFGVRFIDKDGKVVYISENAVADDSSKTKVENAENLPQIALNNYEEPNGDITVRFLVDGVEYATSTGKAGDVITLPETEPTQEHKTFEGWEGYTDGDVYTEAKDYTAKFVDTIYTVKFLDGGNEVKTVSGKYGETFEAPANPEKSGYDFLGWEGFDGTNLTIGGNATYTAKWSEFKGIAKAGEGTFNSANLDKDAIFSTAYEIKEFSLVQNTNNSVDAATTYTVSLVHDNEYLYVYIYSADNDRNDNDRLSFYVVKKGASETTLVETYPNKDNPYSKGKDACSEINVGKVDGGYALKAKIAISSLEFTDGKLGFGVRFIDKNNDVVYISNGATADDGATKVKYAENLPKLTVTDYVEPVYDVIDWTNVTKTEINASSFTSWVENVPEGYKMSVAFKAEDGYFYAYLESYEDSLVIGTDKGRNDGAEFDGDAMQLAINAGSGRVWYSFDYRGDGKYGYIVGDKKDGTTLITRKTENGWSAQVKIPLTSILGENYTFDAENAINLNVLIAVIDRDNNTEAVNVGAYATFMDFVAWGDEEDGCPLTLKADGTYEITIPQVETIKDVIDWTNVTKTEINASSFTSWVENVPEGYKMSVAFKVEDGYFYAYLESYEDSLVIGTDKGRNDGAEFDGDAMQLAINAGSGRVWYSFDYRGDGKYGYIVGDKKDGTTLITRKTENGWSAQVKIPLTSILGENYTFDAENAINLNVLIAVIDRDNNTEAVNVGAYATFMDFVAWGDEEDGCPLTLKADGTYEITLPQKNG